MFLDTLYPLMFDLVVGVSWCHSVGRVMFFLHSHTKFVELTTSTFCYVMDFTPYLPFLNIHNLFTNERKNKHNRMSLNTKDYFVEQISHLSKSVVIVASA